MSKRLFCDHCHTAGDEMFERGETVEIHETVGDRFTDAQLICGVDLCWKCYERVKVELARLWLKDAKQRRTGAHKR